jgi:transketolase
MNPAQTMTMRDAFLGVLLEAMRKDEKIFIVTDDFGAPTLDKIRSEFKDRFINVGIAEQSAVNVATGLAIEEFTAYAYGIAGFMSMRCYEQIRSNLAMAAQVRPLNVNIVGVGAGLSYDLSGPSHHCLEDLTLMRLLPNVEVFSPSDWTLAARIAERSLRQCCPKYIRLDSKPVPRLYDDGATVNLEDGFCELAQGGDTCVVATGFMTQVARRALAQSAAPAGLVDVFAFKPLDEDALFRVLEQYRRVVTVEEGFVNRGSLDAMVAGLLARRGARIGLRALGVNDRYLFEVGNRAHLHKLCGMDEQGILQAIAAPAA